MTIDYLNAGDLPLSVARPAAPVAGALIVIQEAFGVTSHIEDVCLRAAAAGYLAAAPHLFTEAGTRCCPTTTCRPRPRTCRH